MPLQSKAQERFLWAKHPKIAQKFEDETPENMKLPEHVKKMAEGGVVKEDTKKDDKDDKQKDENISFIERLFGKGLVRSTNKNLEDQLKDIDNQEKGTTQTGTAAVRMNKGGAVCMADGGMVGNDLDENQKLDLKNYMLNWAQSNKDPLASVQDSVNAAQNVPHGTEKTETASGTPMNNTDREVNAKIQDSHPGHKSEDLDNYIKGLETDVDKYGPQQQSDVINSLLAAENSPGSILAKGGAGLADAIMQGVARAGSGNFLSNLENREARTNETVGKLIPQLQEMGARNRSEKMALEGMSSNTPLGAAKQKAYATVMKQLFPQMSAKELSAMSINPQIIERMFPEMGVLIEKQAEAEFKKQQLAAETGLRQQSLNQSKAEQDVRRREWEAEHPIAKHMIEKAPVSETGPLGATTIKNGKTYVWSPTTGQYHPQ